MISPSPANDPESVDFALRTGNTADFLAAYRAIAAHTGADWSRTLGPAQRDPTVRRAVAILFTMANGGLATPEIAPTDHEPDSRQKAFPLHAPPEKRPRYG